MATAESTADERTSVFVSYSRKDEVFVERAKAKLEELDLEVWLDLEAIAPSSKWREEIQYGIEGSEALIVVVSPDSMTSAEVRNEIDRAEQLGKRIVPVEFRQYPPESAHHAISSRNWIRWRSDDEEADAVAKIKRALGNDPDWAKDHTRLNARALQWERHGKGHRGMLNGDDLEDAEQKIAIPRGEGQPQVTELMREFVAESRRVATRRLRRVVITSVGVAIVSITLAVLAVLARNEADRQRAEAVRQRDTATAAALAAQSENRLATEPDLAALLALESYRTKDSVDALGSLLRVVDSETTFLQRDRAHDSPVVAITRDEEADLAATGDDGGTVLLWDVTADDLAARAVPIEVDSRVTDLEFDATGSVLSIAQFGAPVQRWDVSGAPRPIEQGTFADYEVLSPEGDLGAGMAPLEDGIHVAVGDVLAGTEDVELFFVAKDPDGEFEFGDERIAFAPDSTRLAVSIDTLVTVVPLDGAGPPIQFDVNDLEGLIDPERGFFDVTSLTFVGDAGRLAIGTEEGHIYLVDVDAVGAGEMVASAATPATTSSVRSLSALPVVDEDGNLSELLGSAHNNGEVRVWVVEGLDATEFVTVRGHDEEALAVSVGSDGAVVSGSFDGDLILSTAFGTAQIGVPLLEPGDVWSHDGDVVDAAFVADGLLVSVGLDDVLKIWDPAAHELVDTVTESGVTALDGRGGLLALGDEDGTVAAFDVTRDEDPTAFEPSHSAEVVVVAISGDGSMVMSGDEDAEAFLWTVDGERVAQVELPDEFRPTSVAFPSADVLWIGGEVPRDEGSEAMAVRIDTATGVQLGEPIRHNADELGHVVMSVAVSPDGTTLATGGSDRRIFIHDLEDPGAPPRELRGHLETVDDLVFVGEDVLFAGDHDGTILMWDVPAGRTVGALTGPVDAITSLALQPDGEVLAAAGEGDRVWVWDLDVEEWVEAACRVAGRNMTDLEWAALQLDSDAVAHCADVDTSDRVEAVYPSVGEESGEE